MYGFITVVFMVLSFIIGYNSSIMDSYFGLIIGMSILVVCQIGCYKSIGEVKRK